MNPNPLLKKSLRFAGIGGFLALILLAGYTVGTMQSGGTNKAAVPNTKYAPSDSADSPLEGIVEDAFAAIGGMITNSGNLLVTGFLDFRGNLVDGGTVIYNTGTNKIEQSVLPFNQGDLIAPGDRPLISGLASYLTSYFNIANLGISGTSASNVKQGVSFGPGGAITGTMFPFQSGDIGSVMTWGYDYNSVYYSDPGCSLSPRQYVIVSGWDYSEYDPQNVATFIFASPVLAYYYGGEGCTQGPPPYLVYATPPSVSCTAGYTLITSKTISGSGCGGSNTQCYMQYCKKN